VIAAILRQNEIHIPRGITQFQAGDEVLAIVDREAAEELARLFGDPQALAEREKPEA
jgi:Trk K+ transport system NAD-binding subunit